MTVMFEQVNGVRGVLVRLGLGQPSSRAFVVGAAAAGVAWFAGQPKAAFREDGSMKPFKPLSPEPDATYTHFLLVPVTAAAAAFLFT